MGTADFHIGGGQVVYLLTPITEQAEKWTDENIDPTAQRFGHCIAIEHGYIQNVVNGIRSDGLTIKPL